MVTKIKGVVQERKIDLKPILEHNKKLYTQNDGYSPDKGLKRIASIPYNYFRNLG